MTRIKVAVRVRPLSNREREAGSTSIVAIENGNTIAITNIKVPEQNAGDSRERIRRYTFDYCLSEDSTQDHIFERIENIIGPSIKRRHHSCVLAYGQSSSGKTHTMMGYPHDPGVTPRLCHRVFGYLQQTVLNDAVLNLKVSVSYLEVYNEKVRDLLQCVEAQDNDNIKKSQSLKVRQHPKKGPYVQGLTEHPVNDSTELLKWLDRGNKQRKVAATSSNPQSSRSHSVFSINCDGVKLHLIDLAGSERASSRCYSTPQFREGANINKSLVALGNVISALAEQSSKQTKTIRRKFVPYRDSVLTWLLKDTLGGNSNTVVVATISPSSTCYSETINTLRFGQRAKLILSHPVINEDPKEKTIRELRAEIHRLKELLKLSQLPQQEVSVSNSTADRLSEQPFPFPTSEVDKTVEGIKEGQVFNSSLTDFDVHNCINKDQQNVVHLMIENRVNEQMNSSNVNQHNIKISNCKKENDTLEKNLQTATDELIPLLKVSSSVNPIKSSKPLTAYDNDHTYLKMDEKVLNMFGSETIIPLKIEKTEETAKLNDHLSVASIRRKSLKKSVPSSSKSISKRELIDNIPKKIEKAIVTEVLNTKTVEAKVDSIRKTSTKPRSQIVAAVTSRLYSKIKKKDIATDTDDINTYKNELPKELTICSNARARLRELTKKALRAHKQKNEETQTELFPVLRLKEVSTDVDDLKISLAEVKNVETESDIIETKDVSVNCTLQQLSNEKKNNGILFTRTCGTQLSEDVHSSDEHSTNERENRYFSLRELSDSISFTKYLHEKYESTIDMSKAIPTSNPIFTNNVNINISHNYIHKTRTSGDIPCDSAPDPAQNVCFPTPDLISNHNSLEQQKCEASDSSNLSTENFSKCEIHYANMEILRDYFTAAETIIPAKENKKCCTATCTIIPKYTEKLYSINISKVQAPEICIVKDLNETLCSLFPVFEPTSESVKLKTSDYEKIHCDCLKMEEPLVLKSIVKQCHDSFNLKQIWPSDEEMLQSDSSDSLECYIANNKKVKFSEKNRSPNNQRIVKAMSDFLAEVTQLMNNVTVAINHLNSHNKISCDTYEVEINVNDIKESKSYRKRRKKIGRNTLDNQQEERNIQSVSVEKTDCSTQCKFDCTIPMNNYKVLVEDSCRRLEEKIDIFPGTEPKIVSTNYNNYNDDILDPLSEPRYDLWDIGHATNDYDVENSSLESNSVTFSDYGSLPRKTYKKPRTPTCSPSAFLKQLTNMRRQIIESSREELMGSNNY